MYLCNVASSLPVFPPIDSLDVAVATTSVGSFLGADFANPHTVTGDYAVLFKCVPAAVGDSVKLFMTNAMTATSSAVASAKYGEGLGYFRYSGGFSTTTDAYGSGTDFEFVVAPRVSFQGVTAQKSTTIAALCTNTAYVFSNTSSFWLGHRQYNLNEFYRKWSPFGNTTDIIQPDSVYTWNFGDGTPDRYTTSGVPSIIKTYTTVGSYSVTLENNYQKMNSFFAGGPSIVSDSAIAAKTTSNCAITTTTSTGINTVSGFENLAIYPNPTVNGKTVISGLDGTNTVLVYDMLGQMVSNQSSDRETLSIDLTNKSNGTYIVKIINSNNDAKVMRIVNQN